MFKKQVLNLAPGNMMPKRDLKGFINLDFSENRGVDWSLVDICNLDVLSYPDEHDLLEKVAEYVGCNKTQVLLTEGADQAIELCARSLNWKKVAVLVPTYYLGLRILEVGDVEVVPIVSEDGDNLLNIDLSNVDGIFFCNPNNPFGYTIPQETIERVLKKTDKPVVVDEAYADYYRKISVTGLVEKYGNLIVIRTFSKYFGLAGLRLGYCVSQEENIQQLLKVRKEADINSVAILYGVYALEQINYLDSLVTEMRSNQKEITELLEKEGWSVWLGGANFVTLAGGKALELKSFLEENKIIVMDISGGYKVQELTQKPTLKITIPFGDEYTKLISLIKKYHEQNNC